MWKKTAILAGVLAVLSSIAYWHEFSLKPKKEDEEEKQKQPFVLKDKQVAEITLSDGKNTFKFKCMDLDKKLCKHGDPSKWQVIAPEIQNGDESNINALLASIASLVSSETISLKEETPETKERLKKEYGISPLPTKLFQAKLADGSTQTVYLGNTHPIGESYFSTNGTNDTVFLIPSHFKVNFERNLTYWRNKKIFPIQTYEVSSFTLKSKKGDITGTRKEGQWTLNVNYPGDIENIDTFLSGTLNIQAKEFFLKSRLPGGTPFAELSLIKEGTTPLVFRAFKLKRKNEKTKKDEDYAVASLTGTDPAYEVDVAAVDRLNMEIEKLRFSKLITSQERFNFKQIQIANPTFGKDGITLNFENNKWVLGTDPKANVIQENVSKILERLSGNRVQGFLKELAKPGDPKLAFEIKFYDDAKAAPKRHLLIWKWGTTLFARDLLSKRIETFKLDNLLDDALPWKKETLIK